MQRQLSSCSARDKMALTSLLLPLCPVGSVRVAAPALLPAAQNRQLEVTSGRQLNFSNALLPLLQRGCFRKAARQENAERDRPTDRPTDRRREHCLGRHRHIGWGESLSKLAAGN